MKLEKHTKDLLDDDLALQKSVCEFLQTHPNSKIYKMLFYTLKSLDIQNNHIKQNIFKYKTSFALLFCSFSFTFMLGLCAYRRLYMFLIVYAFAFIGFVFVLLLVGFTSINSPNSEIISIAMIFSVLIFVYIISKFYMFFMVKKFINLYNQNKPLKNACKPNYIGMYIIVLPYLINSIIFMLFTMTF